MLVLISQSPVVVLAAACIRNLRQTFKYGGRQSLPSKVEVTAATVSTHVLYVTSTNTNVEDHEIFICCAPAL